MFLTVPLQSPLSAENKRAKSFCFAPLFVRIVTYIATEILSYNTKYIQKRKSMLNIQQFWPVIGLAENYIQNVTVSHVTLFLLNCSSFSEQL